MTREAMLARTLVELADTLVADFDVVELLTLLTDRCVEVLDVGAAGLMLVSPEGDLRVMASSSEAMRVLELFELQAQEGPCLDCYRTGQPVVNQDLAAVDGRWPRFAAEALAAGFHSVHALPMRLRGTVIGALNLFHIEPGEMRQADVDAAQALADVATIAILQHRAALEARSSTSNSTTRSTAASSSSRPKEWSPSERASTWSRRSRHCATTPATTTFGWSTSPATSSRHPRPIRARRAEADRNQPEGGGSLQPRLGRSRVSLGHFVLCAENAASTSSFSCWATLKKSRVRSSSAANFVELVGRNREFAVSLLQAERGAPSFRRRVLEGSAGNVAHPQGAHEFEARQSAETVRVPVAGEPGSSTPDRRSGSAQPHR